MASFAAAAGIAVLVMVGRAGTAAAQEGPKLPEGVTTKMVEDGQKIFTGVGTCLTCHGEKGQGTPVGPNLSDEKWLNIDGTYDAIVKLITTGVPQPKEHMVPMLPKAGTQITDEQVKAVAAYVWTLCRAGRAPEACSPGGKAP
jgi:mono/diheme cytochrome c family protein